MTPDRIKFFNQIIRLYDVDSMHTENEIEYTIETEDGMEFGFACVLTTDNRNKPGRYYAITVNMQVLHEGFCLDNTEPNETTKNIMRLIKRCSDKILVQEMRARKSGILSQIQQEKTHS